MFEKYLEYDSINEYIYRNDTSRLYFYTKVINIKHSD